MSHNYFGDERNVLSISGIGQYSLYWTSILENTPHNYCDEEPKSIYCSVSLICNAMKTALQKLFNRFGYHISRTDGGKLAHARLLSTIIPEISDFEKSAIETCLPYSMTNAERMWAVIQSMRLIAQKNVQGDIVECGVWRGGNVLLFSLMLKKLSIKKDIWAYDTFEGMPDPTSADVNFQGVDSMSMLAGAPKVSSKKKGNIWCYAPLDEVKANILAHVDDIQNIRFVKGKVEETLDHEENLPKKISLLRLDTDWYEGTKKGLEVLYPRLVSGGVLILDDYGYWKGARRAFDEYFAGKHVVLHRVDYTCRFLVKE